MMKAKEAIFLSINSESGADVPARVQLLPGGESITGRDGRSWRLSDGRKLERAFADRAVDLPIDIEHITETSDKSIGAVGWIKNIAAEKDGVWGDVEWTDEGRDLIASKKFRYISPVFTHSPNGEINEINGAGLVLHPNLKMKSLNSENLERMNPMENEQNDKELKVALGVSESASVDDMVRAVNSLKTNSVAFGEFVPAEDHKALESRALNAEKRIKEMEEAKHDEAVNEAIDGAMNAGKITPATKEYYKSQCSTADGLKAFCSFIKDAPVVVNKEAIIKSKAENRGVGSGDARAICKMMGLTGAEWQKGLAKNDEENIDLENNEDDKENG